MFRRGVLRRFEWKSSDFVLPTISIFFWSALHFIIVHTYLPKCWTLSGRINISTKVSPIDAKLGEYVRRDVIVAKLHLGDG